MRSNISLDSQAISKHLFSQPLTLCKYLRGSPFTRGLPPLAILQHSITARVFKKAIAEDGIVSEANFENESEECKVLQHIWRNGWLHAEGSGFDIRYVFATQIHRW
jgi:hypothetical protein